MVTNPGSTAGCVRRVSATSPVIPPDLRVGSGSRVCKSPMAIVLKVLYWLAVFVVSLALLVGLIIFFESRDDSAIDAGAVLGPFGLSAP